MAAAAVLSTGLLNGLQSCRNDDVLSFLEMLSWHIASVEVKVWTSDGLPWGFWKWKKDTTDFWNLAEEIVRFIFSRNAVEVTCNSACTRSNERQ